MKLHQLTILLLPLTYPCPNTMANTFEVEPVIQDPVPSKFSICYNHGCEKADTIGLNTEDWQSIRSIFQTPAKNSNEERDKIARAIALMEEMTGKIAGTSTDKGGNLEGMFEPNQMDCIDESTNTTTYLTMIEKEKWLVWHEVEDRSTRYPSIISWPHTTAVIRDIKANQLYAVDSWFLDNGKPPAIVTLEVWKDGWRPEGH